VGARDLIRVLKTTGGVILEVEGGPVHANPEADINSKGNVILPLGLEHPLLAANTRHAAAFRQVTEKSASFGYTSPTRTFYLAQPGDVTQANGLDAIAAGLLAFAELVYPNLRPAYGWVDEMGDNTFPATVVSATHLRCLMWANFFGTAYVDKLGRRFILNAPGWRKEELCDGGILYVTHSSYFEWWNSPLSESVAYFATKEPGIRRYCARPGELPFEVARITGADATGNKEVVYERRPQIRKRRNR
jgi:hypothetical protein